MGKKRFYMDVLLITSPGSVKLYRLGLAIIYAISKLEDTVIG